MSEVRTIDANALKEKFAYITSQRFKTTVTSTDDWTKFTEKEIEDLINNAPTVEPETKLVANVTFNKEEMGGLIENAKEDILAQIERPQGEWIIIDDTVCECPRCKHQQTFLLSPKESNVNFCEKCGADMRGEKK